jgi:hypothetical protein
LAPACPPGLETGTIFPSILPTPTQYSVAMYIEIIAFVVPCCVPETQMKNTKGKLESFVSL